MATMQAQRYGYTQMINNAILTNSSYKLRFAQDLTLYLGEIALDVEGVDLDAGKAHWLDDPLWQGVRRTIETIGGSTDYLEQYFAVNVVFEPLLGELFRSGFVMQVAASQNDFMTPAVVSAAEGDYERNLANTVELFRILAAGRAARPGEPQPCSKAGWPSTARWRSRRRTICSRSGRSRA